MKPHSWSSPGTLTYAIEIPCDYQRCTEYRVITGNARTICVSSRVCVSILGPSLARTVLPVLPRTPRRTYLVAFNIRQGARNVSIQYSAKAWRMGAPKENSGNLLDLLTRITTASFVAAGTGPIPFRKSTSRLARESIGRWLSQPEVVK